MPELTTPLPATGPLWMRHGTCVDGLLRPDTHAQPDSPLTHRGLLETQRAARHLERDHWIPHLILTSPLPRTQQTGQLLADLLGTPPPRPEPIFTEWRAPDCVLGLSAKSYPAVYRAWRERRAHRIDTALPGGESLRTFAARARDAHALTDDLAAHYGRVLLVSHRVLIGAVAALHHERHQPAELFEHAVRFPLAPGHLWASPTQNDVATAKEPYEPP